MNHLHHFLKGGLSLGVLCCAALAGFAAIQVEVNGRALSLSVPATTVRNRTMVPMRNVFEALGAQVNWDGATRTITADNAATHVQLGIGQNTATVNGHAVQLDVPAMVTHGTTLVPLRFVSEALGAQVDWFEATQTVSIFTDPKYATQSVVIPAGTVIPVTLDQTMSSATNHQGDRVVATVRSAQNGDAEFPLGTKLTGIVANVQQKGTGQPGMLDLTFLQAQLPDGLNANMTGSLISLDNNTVTRSSDGRLIANNTTSSDRLTFIAVGAGTGIIIGKLLKKNVIAGGLLGAAAGYIVSELTEDKVQSTDVTVPAGTEFGIRLDHDLVYNTNQAYVTARADYRRTAAITAP